MARDAALGNMVFALRFTFPGMAWLHGSNPVIIHRDVKSNNFLVCFFLGIFKT